MRYTAEDLEFGICIMLIVFFTEKIIGTNMYYNTIYTRDIRNQKTVLWRVTTKVFSLIELWMSIIVIIIYCCWSCCVYRLLFGGRQLFGRQLFYRTSSTVTRRYRAFSSVLRKTLKINRTPQHSVLSLSYCTRAYIHDTSSQLVSVHFGWLYYYYYTILRVL